MNSWRVARYLMVSLWMLRYHMTQGAYSIGFLACQDSYADRRGQGSHFRSAISWRVGNQFPMSFRQWHFWMSLPLRALLPPGLFHGLRSVLYAHGVVLTGFPTGGGGTELNVWSRYHRRSSPTMQGKSLSIKITHSWRVFPHKIEQWQPHYHFLSQQFAKHCHCNRGGSLSKTHFICHQCSWHISIPNPPPHNEPDGPNLVRQALSSEQAWNWILVACNTVIKELANRMRIQQRDCFIKTLRLKSIVDCIGNRVMCWACIIWIKDLLTILNLLLNLPSTFVVIYFVFNDLCQSLGCKLGRYGHLPALLKFISMLHISTIWMNTCRCNVINVILSIRTDINPSIILLPTILLSILFLLSSTLFWIFQSLCIWISSGLRPALTWLVGIIFVGLIMCSAISFPVALFISSNNIFTFYPSFNLKAFERQQLYEIWPYMRSLIICPLLYNPIYSSSNFPCSNVHLNIDGRTYGSVRPPFLSMKSTTSSHCLTSEYNTWRCLGLEWNPWYLTPSKS